MFYESNNHSNIALRFNQVNFLIGMSSRNSFNTVLPTYFSTDKTDFGKIVSLLYALATHEKTARSDVRRRYRVIKNPTVHVYPNVKSKLLSRFPLINGHMLQISH